MIGLCIFLTGAGHMVRDGWPTLHSTHLARFVGALFCFFGALAVWPLVPAALLGATVLAGFYFDMKHGDGQGASGWRDVPYLILSGITSIVPIGLALAWLVSPWAALVVLVGVAKPAIWFGWWAAQRKWAINRFVRICGPESLFEPTRLSAITFGLIVGAIISFGR